VHEHYRLAFPFVEIGDLDVTIPETWHELYLAAGGQGGNLLHRSAHTSFSPPAKNSKRRTFDGAFERGSKPMARAPRSQRLASKAKAVHDRAAPRDF
jgi:hypothetical protein